MLMKLPAEFISPGHVPQLNKTESNGQDDHFFGQLKVHSGALRNQHLVWTSVKSAGGHELNEREFEDTNEVSLVLIKGNLGILDN